MIGGTLIWLYMTILSWTTRWRCEGLEHMQAAWESPQPFVVASWHSRMLIMPVLQMRLARKWKAPPFPLSLMVSNSRDGEFSKWSATLMKLNVIRGSAASRGKTKDKRGVLAAREALQAMRQGGGICVTIDGPKGPPEVVGVGAVKLAQQMGAPIIIFGVSTHGRRLATWDRLFVPNPFSRGGIVFLPPIPTSRSDDTETLRVEVERKLKSAIRRADELAGRQPEPIGAGAEAPAAPPPPTAAPSVNP